MKMLARADVPTVEAGTFPSLKPPQAPRPSSVNLVAPDESASQVDVDTDGPRTCLVNDPMTSFPGPRPAPAASSAMAPPQMFSAFSNHAAHPVNGQPPTRGPMQAGPLTEPRATYPKSHISLSTTTTLVPGKQDSRSFPIQPLDRDLEGDFHHRGSIRDGERRHSDFQGTQLVRVPVPPQEAIHDLPPSRQKSPIRPTGQEHLDQHHSSRATRSNTSRTQPCNQDSQYPEAEITEREPSTKATGKGKGKRAAASNTKAPAAKRSRGAAAPRKGGKPAPKKSSVPSVEELLQRPEYSLLPYDSSAKTRTMPCAEQPVDRPEGLPQPKTQSMEIPESEHGVEYGEGDSPELGQAKTTRTTRSASRALAYTQSKGLHKQGPTDVTASKSALPPCTPADQIIGKPTTPASPTTQARATPHKVRDRHLGRNTSLDLPAITVPAALGDPLLPVAQQCLVHDENFDLLNADSRLEAWNNLAAPTRLTALRSYLCELILKEQFVDLVKNISSLWEGAILEGRVTRSRMATARGDATDDREEEL
ncbi:hypothetical protein PV04_09869 [Phialophora macrospora]|uniref:Uncharacterized protein n=1 Tax=Phialophora macrospora TaxID=1851006 RepID=A0A0D2CD46_9EURO|nr:hypothetical protein PV04_09869 [Phialophora macrospora]